jgi:hypothetical protein
MLLLFRAETLRSISREAKFFLSGLNIIIVFIVKMSSLSQCFSANVILFFVGSLLMLSMFFRDVGDVAITFEIRIKNFWLGITNTVSFFLVIPNEKIVFHGIPNAVCLFIMKLQIVAAYVCCKCLLQMLAANVSCKCLLQMLAANVCCKCLLQMFAANPRIVSWHYECCIHLSRMWRK